MVDRYERIERNGNVGVVGGVAWLGNAFKMLNDLCMECCTR